MRVAFEDIRKTAREAVDQANLATAEEATDLFRQHLRAAGLPESLVARCRIRFAAESNRFEQHVPQQVADWNYGNQEEPPKGALESFEKKISYTEIHKKNLFDASMLKGLI